MAKRFIQGNPSQHDIYQQKYTASRMNLLLVIAFTVINLVLLVTDGDSYFLFSAFLPYFITFMGMYLCGRFPEEYYEGEMEAMVFLDNSVFVVLLVISIVITLFYLLTWLLSGKNRVGWLIVALVFFAIDTVAMFFLNGIHIDSILDILFHAWVIYYLALGIHAHNKLKKLPPEEPAPLAGESVPEAETEGEEASESNMSEASDSFVLRRADRDAKHRVLAEARVQYYTICYRRVKHTNELVVNGNVYDELRGVIEYPHTLKACIDGHYIAASYTGTHSIISFDGEDVAKKVRLF